jgi:release factor glutamine methyltransferase
MTTIRDLSRASELTKLDTRVLLAYVTGFTTAQLISRDDYILTELQLAKYQELYIRAKEGEPIAYLIGYKEFYGRKFCVTNDTLIPRPDTELLIDKVIELAPHKANLLDLGTGSGCIAITCNLERTDIKTIAVDKSNAALVIARINAQTLNAPTVFIESDWFSNVTGKFDIIASNPPYIEAQDTHLAALRYEPQSALTDFADGLSCIRIIISQSVNYLKNNGWLIIEHGYNQGTAVREIFSKHKFSDIVTVKDYARLDRITLGKFETN